jgi:4-hydroxybenzoate polyprenyltransferase
MHALPGRLKGEDVRLGWTRKTVTTLEMIKWEHSVFVLPFALIGAMLAAGGWPPATKILWIVVCMVTARSAAMAFNRLVDADIDAKNPRTTSRAIPAGRLSRGFVGGFTLAMVALFIGATSQLNRVALLLSPLALAIVLIYSYTKRFTRWSHIFLGLAMGIAPSAAWIAVRGSLDPRILILTGAVLCWGAGFDVLYSCQDFDHDRKAGLHSIPAAIGIPAAFWVSHSLHVIALVLLAVLVRVFLLGASAWFGIAVVGALLLYEHMIVSPHDLRRLNAAFFTTNGVIAILFFCFVAADFAFRK